MKTEVDVIANSMRRVENERLDDLKKIDVRILESLGAADPSSKTQLSTRAPID